MLAEFDSTWRKIRTVLRGHSNLNEANTKLKVIEPLLNSLGWDVLGEEVFKEYSDQFGTRSYSVDYALLIKHKPQIYVEAKPLGTELTEHHAKQVITYAKAADVRWCILTNGRGIRLYNSQWGMDPDDTLFLSLELDPERDPPEDLRLLSRDAVSSGKLDEAAQQSHFNLKLRAELLSLLPELESHVINEAKNKVFARLRESIRGLTRKQVFEAIRPMLRLVVKEGETPPPVSGREQIPRRPGEPVPVGPIPDLHNGLTILCPSERSGVDWMKRHYAWGYVRIARTPDYFALYVSDDIRQVRYFAQVQKVVDPADLDSPVRETFASDSTYSPGKKVIILQPGSLIELASPIPLGQRNRYAMRGLRYTTLEGLRNARSLDDIA